MFKSLILSIAVLFATQSAIAQDEEPQTPDTAPAADANEPQDREEATETSESAEPRGNGVDQPKAMSGMSILGNEEAPKSLVIIPWKSSEIGSGRDLANSLDDRAAPVDKDVFLRQLHYYEIRAGK